MRRGQKNWVPKDTRCLFQRIRVRLVVRVENSSELESQSPAFQACEVSALVLGVVKLDDVLAGPKAGSHCFLGVFSFFF